MSCQGLSFEVQKPNSKRVLFVFQTRETPQDFQPLNLNVYIPLNKEAGIMRMSSLRGWQQITGRESKVNGVFPL
jgi:hypothetical protein